MKAIERLAGRVGNFPVEIPAALLAAGAVAFLAAISPDWRVERLVGTTGLGSVLPAARPPLGDTARLLLALVGAGLTFVLVWTGLRALEPRDQLPAGYPAFRAKDLHPDAPLRRPILAGEEFGTPDVLELSEPLPGPLAVAAVAPLPSFLQPVPDNPLPKAEAQTAPEPLAEVAAPSPIAGFAPESAFVGLAADMAAAPTPPAVPQQSVPELMARLERGLASRGAGPVRPVANDDTDAALRAIADELRQVARTG